MTEQEWLTATDPYPMWIYLRGRASDRQLRLFVVACCRRVWQGLRDERSRRAVEVAERFADGNVSLEELLAARDTAYVAVDDCLEHSEHSEDQATAAFLAAEPCVDDVWQPDGRFPESAARHSIWYAIDGPQKDSIVRHIPLLRDIFGNPFRPVTIDPRWLTETVVALATGIYEERAFDRMPILADALEDAGCDHADILGHCRGDGPHVRGCWVVDLLLGKS